MKKKADNTGRKAAGQRDLLHQQIPFILGATGTGLDIIDAQFNLRYVDPGWARKYGDYAGRKCFEYFMGRDKPCPDCALPEVLRTKKPRVSEETLVREDNRPIQVTSYPFQDENGEWLVAEINVDVAERKKMTESLRRAADVVNASPAIVFIWRNAEGWPVEYVSDNCERILGVCPETLLSGAVSYASLIHHNDRARVAREVAEHSRHAVVSKFSHAPYRLVRPDGQIVWVDDLTDIRRDAQGHVTHYQGIVLDITDRMRAEAALRESESRLRSTLLSIGDAVICTDAAGLITDINTVAERLTGWTAAAARGRSVEEVFCVINEETRAPAPNSVARALRDGKITGFSNHLLLVARDGVQRPIAENAAPIRDNAGTIIGVVLVFRDQTAERTAERAMLRRLAMESFVADFTARCINVETDKIDAAVNDLLCGIGELAGVDGADVFLLDGQADTVSNTHSWNTPAIPQPRGLLMDLPCAAIPWWMEKLRDGKTIEIARLDDLPAAAAAERKILADFNVKSALFVPIARGTLLYGFMGLSVAQAERAWDIEDRRIVETLANILALILERRQVELVLHERENRYRALFDGATDAVMVLAAGQFVDCNAATLQMFGCRSKAEFIGTHPGKLSPPRQVDGADSMSAANERIAAALAKGGNHFEWVHRRVTGEDFYADVKLSPITVQGRTMVQAVVRDITERREMELQLRAGEERMRNMLSNIPGIIYRCVNDGDWTMLFISDLVEEITGYPAADFIRSEKRSYSSIIHPEDRARVAMVIGEAVRRGQPFILDYRIVRRDGAVRWVHESGRGEADADGVVYQLDGAIFDVTDERLRADELSRNLDMQNTINALLHMSLGNTSMDQLLRAAMDAIMRVPWTGLDGRAGVFLIDGESDAMPLACQCNLPDGFPKSCKLDQGAPASLVYCAADCPSPAGRQCPGAALGARYCASLISDGQLVGLLVLFARDPGARNAGTERFLQLVGDVLAGIIARKRADEQLKASQQVLEDMNARLQQNQAQLVQSEKMASVGQLAAGVAHEINNPVGFISSNLNTMADYVKTFKELAAAALAMAAAEADAAARVDAARRIAELRQREDIDYILADVDNLVAESADGARRVQEIVQSLKSFSRLDEAVVKEANLNECLETTLKVVWNELKYKCEVVREFGALPHLRCYPGQLNQVFMNLLVNAAQAIPEKGTITIHTESDEREIRVSVADTGQGIPPEHIPKLFEPFFTTKPVGKGTGLGLSVSYNIVQKHGGRIEVASAPGKGTTFTIHLPLAGVPDS